jgi:hypothetical protein
MWAGVQGFPSVLLGQPGVAEDGKAEAIRVDVGDVPPDAGPYQRGDLVFHAPPDYSVPANQPEYVGWVCVDDSGLSLTWKRFGKIEP